MLRFPKLLFVAIHQIFHDKIPLEQRIQKTNQQPLVSLLTKDSLKPKISERINKY